MRSGDIAPWQRFLDQHEDSFAPTYYYNLRVSSENKPVPDLPPELQPIARNIRRKRIDVVAWSSTEPLIWPVDPWCILDELNEQVWDTTVRCTIIEVKKLATTTAIGQLVSYPVLFRQTFPMSNIIPVRVLLVAERLGTDVEFLCKWLGIPYLLFPP
jgi:hypothetical protein